MAKVEVSMPKMGESITEGTVIEWFKKPGDTVEEDETLLEIGTDKVDTEVPSPAAGVLAEIRVEAGDTVDVGTIIALIETDADAVVNGQDDAPDDDQSEDEAEEDAPVEDTETADAETVETETDEAAPAEASSDTEEESDGSGGERIEIEMPKMGESIMEGTIITWHKQPGDKIEEDETLLEIATDKVDTDVPSPASGTVLELLAEEGDTVDVGSIIAVIGTGEAKLSTAKKKSPAPEKKQKAEKETESEEEPPARPRAEDSADTGPIPREGPNGEFFSPLVRSIAEEEGVSVDELASIDGSGRDGRVTKNDLLSYIETRGEAPAKPAAPSKATAKAAAADRKPSGPAPLPSGVEKLETREDGRVEVLKMDRMRQIIAEHMTRSKATSAHVTSFAEADVTNLVRIRERNKRAFQKREGIKLTYTPFFVYAAVQALRDHPILNASVEGNEILLKKDYHVGIAVAIGKTGLLAPVIRHAGQKNIAGLAHASNDLAERARNKQLLPDQLQGGTFTVTNIGSLGSIMGTPIINQPQVGILATGAIKKRPVVIEDPDLGDIIAVRQIMYISLSYDHRIVDGAMGASFLKRFVEVLQDLDPDTEI